MSKSTVSVHTSFAHSCLPYTMLRLLWFVVLITDAETEFEASVLGLSGKITSESTFMSWITFVAIPRARSHGCWMLEQQESPVRLRWSSWLAACLVCSRAHLMDKQVFSLLCSRPNRPSLFGTAG